MYGTNIYSGSKAIAYGASYLPEITIDTKCVIPIHFDKKTLEGKLIDNRTIDRLLEKLESIGDEYNVQPN